VRSGAVKQDSRGVARGRVMSARCENGALPYPIHDACAVAKGEELERRGRAQAGEADRTGSVDPPAGAD
jgi:hypothetical protein